MCVVAVDKDEAACKRVSGELAANGRVRVIVADIGSAAGAKLAVQTAIDVFERIDLLCNNAAYHPSETLEAHDHDQWRETFRVNVDGTMLCCQAAIPYMRRQGGGCIVNMGSISGILSYSGGSAYAASKAAIAMITRTLALEVGAYGIRVNCIAPGSILHRSGEGDEPMGAAAIPIGRRGRTDDVAALVSYLASDAASYITGAIIPLDGGATAGRVRSRRPSS